MAFLSKRIIPNAFTMANLSCGCMALYALSIGQFDWAFYWVSAGIFFDFFDGFFARWLGVSGPLGVQLDSLADMVNCGVVPGYAVFVYLHHSAAWPVYAAAIGFVITLGSAYRLARFNLDTRQSHGFIGLPTPANALLFTSWLAADYTSPNVRMAWMMQPELLVAAALLSVWVMNAELPLFSLKIKKPWVWRQYAFPLLFIAMALLAFAGWGLWAIPFVIVGYVASSAFLPSPQAG